ncbi:RNA polymerase sigma factor [Actinomyces procaprae]|uniref:RNA polymerase sigma factor n=1 Tax=Actinomyces procaprae TaxID=2560010 RepID=UPI0023D8F44E|nr:sigma-70 family RNA polymerase sigma factor [Actinomyces procaprae]
MHPSEARSTAPGRSDPPTSRTSPDAPRSSTASTHPHAVEAFQRIYTDHQPHMLAIARQRLGRQAVAEDITAEAFRIAWQHHVSGGEVTVPWLYRTLRNLIANQYRRHERDSKYFNSMSNAREKHRSIESAVDDSILIRQAMGTLSDADRELLRMAYWEELTRSEMASVLGITTVAVRVRLARARQRLRAALGEPG